MIRPVRGIADRVGDAYPESPMSATRLPPAAAAVSPTLLGRDRQLARVARVVATVRTGRAQFVLIEGESGFGKTALLRAAVETVPHWPVRAAVCDENESELPFGVLNQLLADVDEPERLDAVLSGGVAPDVSPMAAGASLLALIDTSEGATCITIDDAQWMDQHSAEALWFAGRRALRDRLLIIITARQEETEFLERIRHLVADEDRGVRLHVDGLSVEHVSALIRRETGLPSPRRLASRLVAATDGNALHVRSLLNRALAAPDPLESLDRLLSGTPPAAPGFRALTQQTLDRLNPAARAVLEVVAVLNNSASITDITAVAAHYGGFRLTSADIDEALATGLITLAGDDTRVTMPHQRVRAIVVSDLPLQVKLDLNAAAGRVVGGLRGLDHRVHAAAGPDEMLASELDEAAARASAAHEVERAFRYALKAAALSSRPASKERRTVDAGIYALLARRVGLLVRAVDEFENLTAGTERDVLLGNAALAGADLITARQHLLSAVAAGSWGTVRTRTMRASANETLAQLALAEDDFDGCQIFAAAALEAIAQLRAYAVRPVVGAVLDVGDIEASAVSWSAMATWQSGRGTGGLAAIDRLISDATATGLLAEHGILFLTRGFIRRQQMRLNEAIADLECGVSLTDLGRPELAPFGRVELALALFRNGEWDAAATAAATAASLAEDVQNPWLQSAGYAIAAMVPAARGDRVAAEAWLAEAEAGPTSLRTGAQRRLATFARVLEARAAGDTSTVVALTRDAIATDPENSQIERAWWIELLEEARRPGNAVQGPDPLAALSNREREVAHLAAQGLTNREVAQKLFVSVKGVEYHMGNVLAKLGIASRRGIRSMIEGN